MINFSVLYRKIGKVCMIYGKSSINVWKSRPKVHAYVTGGSKWVGMLLYSQHLYYKTAFQLIRTVHFRYEQMY
jgi:hypothetical protein